MIPQKEGFIVSDGRKSLTKTFVITTRCIRRSLELLKEGMKSILGIGHFGREGVVGFGREVH